MTPDEIEQIADAVVARMAQQGADGVQWADVRVPKPSSNRPPCSALDDVAMLKLTAIAAKTYGGSISGVMKTAALYYLACKWPGHVDAYRAIAAREGITLEECLSRVAAGELGL
jgi:hypothetical protein